MKSLWPYLWVGLGGFVGANARYLVGRLSDSLLGIHFPFGTFLINVSGSFMLGIVAAMVSQKWVPYSDHVRLAVAVGFIGSYTTFSTYELESHALMERGSWLLATVNLAGSLVAGLVAVRLGVWIVRRWA